ncbi:DUF433 domain-containing protein [Taibaiella chishuiensis]|uniref:Uncharacterized protein (DUF433 family) n=1 Tax=Taibaiella chishuiensis TaxID=1434707 RepID=A0A2P8D796_9BACT|nr:DUF433 domain-containing protein [Taibaiella chishuiensis]PSK93106.1 uncharacterized protein (DUF433 family) [Taibaiella chishuiensis]
MSYIERNPEKCFGMPSLRNRRITVYDLVIMLFLEPEKEAYLADLQVSKDQAIEALEYCSQQLCKQDKIHNISPFCDGCILRTVAEGYIFEEDLYYEAEDNNGKKCTFSKESHLEIFGGSMQEFKAEEEGAATWIIAQSLLTSGAIK